MKKYALFLALVILIILLTGCGAPGANPNKNISNGDEKIAGYWEGLWHAIIMPYCFIGSWFTDNVNIYEVHNNGFWYHIGLFTPGIIISLIGFIRVLSEYY